MKINCTYMYIRDMHISWILIFDNLWEKINTSCWTLLFSRRLLHIGHPYSNNNPSYSFQGYEVVLQINYTYIIDVHITWILISDNSCKTYQLLNIFSIILHIGYQYCTVNSSYIFQGSKFLFCRSFIQILEICILLGFLFLIAFAKNTCH